MNNKEKYASCVQTKLCSRPFAYRLCRLDYADFKSGLRNPLRGGQRWPQAGIRDAVMPRLCANVKKEMAYRFVPNGFFLLWRFDRFGFFYYLAMAEIHSCQNLSNFHIVIWWSDRGPALVARELKSYVDRCPPSLRETVLKGVIAYIFRCVLASL